MQTILPRGFPISNVEGISFWFLLLILKMNVEGILTQQTPVEFVPLSVLFTSPTYCFPLCLTIFLTVFWTVKIPVSSTLYMFRSKMKSINKLSQLLKKSLDSFFRKYFYSGPGSQLWSSETQFRVPSQEIIIPLLPCTFIKRMLSWFDR